MNVSWSAGLDLMSKNNAIGRMNPMLKNPELAQRYAGAGALARKGSWVHVGQSLRNVPDGEASGEEEQASGKEGRAEEGNGGRNELGAGEDGSTEGFVFTVTSYQQAATFKCDSQQERDAFIALFRAVQQYTLLVQTRRLEEAAAVDMATGEYSVKELSVKQLKALLKYKAVSVLGASEKGDLQALVLAHATAAEVDAAVANTLDADADDMPLTEIAILRARAKVEVPPITVATNVTKLGLLQQKLTGQVTNTRGKGRGARGSVSSGSSRALLQSSRDVLHTVGRDRTMGRGLSGRFSGVGGAGASAGAIHEEATAAEAVHAFVSQGNGRNIPKLLRKLKRVSLMSVAVAKEQGEALVAILLAVGEHEHGLQALINAQLGEEERGVNVADAAGGHREYKLDKGGRGSSVNRVGSADVDGSLFETKGPAAGLFKAMLEVALGISTLGLHDALKNAVTLLFRAAASGTRGLYCVLCVFDHGKQDDSSAPTPVSLPLFAPPVSLPLFARPLPPLHIHFSLFLLPL
jgi:hypothetical protein